MAIEQCDTRQEAAAEFIRHGWSPVPIPAGSKNPGTTGWQKGGYSVEQFAGVGNIGLLTGTRSNGLVDVDLDCPEAVRLAPYFLPPTNMMHGRRSKPRSHQWYVVKGTLPKTQQYEDSDGSMLVELRSTGGQTVVPPSIHESGEAVERVSCGEPVVIESLDLQRRVAHLAVASVLARHWPQKGSRHEFSLAVSGYLLNGGLNEDDVARIIEHTARVAGDEEASERVTDVGTTAECIEAGGAFTGGPTLARFAGKDVVRSIGRWLGFKKSAMKERKGTPREQTSSSSIIRLEDVEAAPVEWLWQGYIPLGTLSLIDGDPGGGKTMLMIDLAGRVTTGRTMPDRTSGVDGGVVLVSVEDDLARTIRPRLEAAGADISRMRAIQLVRVTDTDTGEVYERSFSLTTDLSLIEEAIDEVNAKLVVVDPIMACLGTEMNSYRDQDVRAVLTPLIKLAERTGAAVVIVRHLNKGSSENALYRGGGSIGFIGSARSAFLLAKHPDDDEKRVLASTKCNLGKKPPSMTYHIAANEVGVPRIVWEGTNDYTADRLAANRSAYSEGQQDILTVLKTATKPLSPQEITELTGQNGSTVRSSLVRLEARGAVVKDVRGRYSVSTISNKEREMRERAQQSQQSQRMQQSQQSQQSPTDLPSGHRTVEADAADAANAAGVADVAAHVHTRLERAKADLGPVPKLTPVDVLWKRYPVGGELSSKERLIRITEDMRSEFSANIDYQQRVRWECEVEDVLNEFYRRGEGQVLVADMHHVMNEYCHDPEDHRMSRADFTTALTRRGFEVRKAKGKDVVVGLVFEDGAFHAAA